MDLRFKEKVCFFVCWLCLAVFCVGCDDNPEGDAGVDSDTENDGDVHDVDGDAVTDADGESEIEPGCNPLAPEWDCLIPYPSDFFLVEDSTMPTGRRLEFSGPGLPLTTDDEYLAFRDSRQADGFPRLPNILAYFPFPIDETDLVFHTDDIELSVTDQSPTVLINGSTGERVAHFAELDLMFDDDNRRALLIHPMEPLDLSTRYIVAITGLNDADGNPIEAPSGFAKLRDGTAEGDPNVGELFQHYEDSIFPVLTKAGLDRAELILAWDFTTASRENRTADMLRMRELAIEIFEKTPPAVTITESVDESDEFLFRTIRGTITVPLFVENAEPGAMLLRNEEGEVAEPTETMEVDFLASIPNSLSDGHPGRIVQYGHGFFMDRNVIINDFGREFADRTGSVMIAVDWLGMSTADRIPVGNDIYGDFPGVFKFVDRLHQAMVNQIALSYAIQTTLAETPEFMVDGNLVYEPQDVYYYGISNGQVLGGTFLALSPHIEQAALNVGGMPFSLIMFRSLAFDLFVMFFDDQLGDPLSIQKVGAMAQTMLDRVDPSMYLDYIFDEPLENSPSSRRVLMQVGIGDPLIPNISSHVFARALNLPVLQPNPRTIYGLESVEGPVDSAYVEFDFGEPDPIPGTYSFIPEEDNDVHILVRRLYASMDQIDEFLTTSGQVRNYCDDACDPE